jgi:hypothetical protein
LRKALSIFLTMTLVSCATSDKDQPWTVVVHIPADIGFPTSDDVTPQSDSLGIPRGDHAMRADSEPMSNDDRGVRSDTLLHETQSSDNGAFDFGAPQDVSSDATELEVLDDSLPSSDSDSANADTFNDQDAVATDDTPPVVVTCPETLCVAQPERTVPEVLVYPSTTHAETHRVRVDAGASGARVTGIEIVVGSAWGAVSASGIAVFVSSGDEERQPLILAHAARTSQQAYLDVFDFVDPITLEAGDVRWVEVVYPIHEAPNPTWSGESVFQTIIQAFRYENTITGEAGVTCTHQQSSTCWMRSGEFRIEWPLVGEQGPSMSWDVGSPSGVTAPGIESEIARVIVNADDEAYELHELKLEFAGDVSAFDGVRRLQVMRADRSTHCGTIELDSGMVLASPILVGTVAIPLTSCGLSLGVPTVFSIVLDTQDFGRRANPDVLSVRVPESGVVWSDEVGNLQHEMLGLPLAPRLLRFE